MGSRNSTRQTENVTQTTTPPSWAMPGITDLAGRISAIVPTMPGPRYTGDFVAQPGPMQQQLPGMYADAAGLANSLIPQAQSVANQAMSNMPQFANLPGFTGANFDPITYQGPGLDQGTQSFASYDPTAVQPVVQAAIAPIMRQLMEQTLPSMQSSAIASGAYSGTGAMNTLPSLAIRDANRQAMEVATGIGYQDFTDQQQRRLEAFGLGTQRGLGEGQLLSERELGAAEMANQFNIERGQLDTQQQLGSADVMSQRLNMMPDLMDTIMRMSASGADLSAQGAGIEQLMAQAGIDNQLAQHEYGVRYPFQGLDYAAQLLSGLASPYGTTNRQGTSETVQRTGGLAPLIGGLTGLGMAAFGFPGGAAGAAGGGGFLSNIFGRQAPQQIVPTAGWFPGRGG